MATTGWLNNISRVQTNAQFAQNVAWSSPNNIASDNNVGATATIDNGGGFGNDSYTIWGQFSISIPSGATINGVEMRVKRRVSPVSGSPTVTVGAWLSIAGATITGATEKASSFTGTTSWGTKVDGSSVDTWGKSLTPANVNSSNFRLGWDAQVNTLSTQTVQLDYLQCRVHYTVSTQGVSAAGGIASAEALGTTAEVEPIWRIEDVIAVASTEAFGAVGVTTAIEITVGNIASAEAFGTAVITSTVAVSPSGAVSAEAFGSPIEVDGGAQITPDGIPSAEVVPETHDFFNDQIALPSIPSAAEFGTAVIAQVIQAEPIFEGAFGFASVVQIVTTGIVSSEAFGTAEVIFHVSVDSVVSAEALGTSRIVMIIFPESFNGEPLGTPTIDTFEPENVDELWTVRFR